MKLNIEFKPEYDLDPRYPYFCDFYLPKTDTFIELHGFWMHGKHWFDSNNLDDLNMLNSWIAKSKTRPIYKEAIKCWTEIDVKKRECAIKNNLNYIVLWTKQDIDNWIDTLK